LIAPFLLRNSRSCVPNPELHEEIDRIWDSFWSGGISNPLEVIEQITCPRFIRRLDDLHTLEENKATPRQAADVSQTRVVDDGLPVTREMAAHASLAPTSTRSRR
jgi:hypothetical protein